MKKTRDRARSEQALLEAATRCFAERGFDAATTKEIAQRAGVSEGLIHRYFGSKDGLLVAVMASFLEKNALGPELGDSPADFLRRSFEEHEQSVDAMRVLVSRAIVDPQIGSRMGGEIWGKHVDLLAAKLRERYPGKEVEAAAFALSAFSFVLGFMGRQVFAMDADRLRRIGDWLAETITEKLQA